MSAYLSEFWPPIQKAVDKMAISPQTAWEIEEMLDSDSDLTPEDYQMINWINLVNCPVKHLEAQ
mgnify:CR=1 FL=1